MLRVTVEFWGPARDVAKTESTVLELDEGACLGDVRRMLQSRNPQLDVGLRSMRLAVHEAFAADAHPMKNGDVVAVIPPVSGG